VEGHADRGERLIRASGCAACHVVPGISRPRGLVGPSLALLRQRAFIAGVLPNTPTNLVRWVMNPRAIDSKTAMPALGLDEAEAQDVVAYLLSMD
jgi:mono/diheme cytochrome c family protein